jgi:hypothetical protein
MAKIFLTTTCKTTSYNPGALDNFDRVVKWSRQDTKKQHQVVDCPRLADVILFVCDRRFYHSGIYSSDIFKQYREKSLVIDFADRTIPRIPGLYAIVPKYLQQYPIYEYLFYDHGDFEIGKAAGLFVDDYKYLFSFMGSVKTYPIVRSKVVGLVHPRAYLRDTNVYPDGNIYCDTMINSKFILCPRGLSPSSIRVFETMRAGRVPVIISDDWRENQIDGNWEEFSVRVSERDVESIPHLLERLEPKAIEMGQKAFVAWEKNFSIHNCFNWLVETCLRIQNARADHKKISSRNIYLETIGTHHFIPFWKEFIRNRIGAV